MPDTSVDGILALLRKEFGAMIPRPATDEDLEQCRQDLDDLGLEPLPPGYEDFLKKNNGLAWNGIIFYGTDRVIEADNPSGFVLTDIVSENDEFNERYEFDEKVLLGRADEEYYAYNTETRAYEIVELGEREALEEYGTFAELFYETAGGRLGLHDE